MFLPSHPLLPHLPLSSWELVGCVPSRRERTLLPWERGRVTVIRKSLAPRIIVVMAICGIGLEDTKSSYNLSGSLYNLHNSGLAKGAYLEAII
jgi:hypothetical protein